MNIMIPAVGVERGFSAAAGGETLPVVLLLAFGLLSLAVSAFLLRRFVPAAAAVRYHPDR